MLAYNIWCYLKLMTEISTQDNTPDTPKSTHVPLKCLINKQIRITRLMLLFIAAKVIYYSKGQVKYPIHDTRTSGLMNFLNYLDKARSKVRSWI